MKIGIIIKERIVYKYGEHHNVKGEVNMKKLKTIIIIIFVIIVVLITSLIIVKNISKENQQKMATPEVEEERIF